MKYEAFRDQLFAEAAKAGCAAEVYFEEGDSFKVRIDKQEVDAYTVSRDYGLGLRVQKDGRDGYAYTEVFEDAAGLVARALDNAAAVSASDVHPMQGKCVYPEVKELPNPVFEMSEAEKIELARALERAALAADPRVDRVQYDMVCTASSRVCIANTNGLEAEAFERISYCMVEPVLMENGEIHDSFAYRINADTTDVEGCAREAVADAAAQFGAGPVPPGEYRTLWTNQALSDMLGAFAGLFNADRAQKGMSALAGKEGQKIAAECITMVDDPLYPLYPRAFDAEGTPSEATVIVENGVLCSLMHNLKTAAKAGVASTSNASRAGAASPVSIAPSQFYVKPGEKSFDELTGMLGDGLIITDVSGLHAGVNPVSGEFSLLAKGKLVEGGKIVRSVEQITVGGSFFTLFGGVEAVGSDLRFGLPGSGCMGCPSVLVSKLMVAGK
ncbi:MAG: TldD/PmbA family protein [Ruminococcaceae bacterium]|nr:TldD/PmbA family protein [Oscillospiraceae bacterium]